MKNIVTFAFVKQFRASFHVVSIILAGGHGAFAVQPIAKDETVVVWSGKIVTGKELAALPQNERDYVYQVSTCIQFVLSVVQTIIRVLNLSSFVLSCF